MIWVRVPIKIHWSSESSVSLYQNGRLGAKFIIIMQTQLHQVGEKSSIESHEYPNHE